MTTTPDHPPPTSAQTRSRGQRIGLWLGPLLFALTLTLDLEPGKPEVTRMAALALLMAAWWITDAIPLFATALLPLVLFPLLGIERTGATAPIYFNSTIVLFLGGFMIALTMEKWNVHRRIALWVIRAVGGGPARIVLGFMLASALLSMWISNTATAIMMIPVGLAVILRMEEQFGREPTRPFSVAVMLGIAYACSAGGIATLVGTPPNLSLERIFQITFPEAPPLAFGVWFVMAAPISVLLLACAWALITQVFFRIPREVAVDRGVVESEMRKLGPIGFEEKAVLAVFGLTAVLWVFRAPIAIGGLTIPGWSALLPFGHLIDDGTVAIAMGRRPLHGPHPVPRRPIQDGDGSRRGAPAAVEHRAALRRRIRPGPRLPDHGTGPLHRRRIRRAGRGAARGPRPAHLPGDHLPHRAHLEHGHHRDGAAHLRRRGRFHRGPSPTPDDPGHPVRLLRLHDAGGHAPQRRGLRQRPRQNLGDGAGRHRPQRCGRGADHPGLPRHGTAALRDRAGGAAGLGASWGLDQRTASDK